MLSLLSPRELLLGWLLFAGVIVGQLVVARWIDLHPILWPAAPLCALASVGALSALFVGPVDAISTPHRKLIARLAFSGLTLAAASLISLYFADQINALGWLGFGSKAFIAVIGVIAGGIIFRRARKRP
jgi:hypothetical protein